MKLLRTPDSHFQNLADYPFKPHYLDINDRQADVSIRMHYIDEGEAASQPVLMLHGEPSWSFLYRKMVSPFVDAGYRVVAPDLPGFGKSDKPSARTDYTYARHVAWMQDWLRAMDLNNIILICQDWGGLIGLRLVAAEPHRFARVVTSNTMLPTGDHDPGEAFKKWQSFSQEVPMFPTGKIINGGTVTELPDEVVAAYDAPFPDESYKEGARQFPLLVPTTPDNPESQANRDAWKVLMEFEKPWLCAFGDSDPITGAAAPIIQKLVPGCQGQPHTTLQGGGHFIQEDCGEALARVVLDWLK
ncbi:MAG: haloalkane dehalogenase [Xanthomonadales bacterium]|nr:haloalkane dehalogenase [Xanthomonadales bacterium]